MPRDATVHIVRLVCEKCTYQTMSSGRFMAGSAMLVAKSEQILALKILLMLVTESYIASFPARSDVLAKATLAANLCRPAKSHPVLEQFSLVPAKHRKRRGLNKPSEESFLQQVATYRSPPSCSSRSWQHLRKPW